jgi:hypothetical protein
MYGSGLAVGMGSGLACGIGCGVAAGRRKAREELRGNLRRVVEDRRLILRDGDGRTVTVDELLAEVVPPDEIFHRKLAILAGVGLAVLAILGVVVVFLLR